MARAMERATLAARAAPPPLLAGLPAWATTEKDRLLVAGAATAAGGRDEEVEAVLQELRRACMAAEGPAP